MSMCQELSEDRPSRLEELTNENIHLEATVKEQANIIEDLKKKLFENSKLNESELLTTNNKISLQETRILQYTIADLREAMEKAKEETAMVRGFLDQEKQLSFSKSKELKKKSDECDSLSEELKKLRAELKSAKKMASDETWLEKEQALRQRYQIQLAEDQNKISALNAKISSMRSREKSLRDQLERLEDKHKEELLKVLEKARMDVDRANELALQQKSLAAKDEENFIRMYLEEIIKNEQAKDAENRDIAMGAHIEKLLVELKQLKEITNIDHGMAELQGEVGSLRTTKIFLEKQVGEAEENVKKLNEQLLNERRVVEEQKARIAELEERLAQTERSSEITHRYLLEDISKVKQAKAKLRCEFLQLRREHNRLLGAHGEPPLESLNISISTTDESGLCSECILMRKELKDMQERLKATMRENKAVTVVDDGEQREKDDDEEIAIQKEVVERMKKEAQIKDARIGELSKTLRVLDEQCERFLKLKKAAEAGREKAKEQLEAIRQQLGDAKHELELRAQMEIDVETLRQEKDRLAKKVVYLTEELRETQTDYREELALLAKKMSETKRKDATENEAYAMKVEQLETEKRQMETMLRSLERQLVQLKDESARQLKQADEAHSTRAHLVEENGKLREGLATAIAKAEKYKEDAETSKEALISAKEEVKKIREGKCDAELLVEQLNQTINERERLVAYLQSQIQMKSASKVKKSSSHSTLMSTSDISVTEVVETELLQSQGIGGGGDEKSTVALLRDNYSLSNDTTAFSKSYFEQKSYTGPVPSAPAYLGTMKHDIPHRWKTYLVLKQVKCVVCLEGLPRVRHGLKCAECGILVHRGCSKNISNSCGLPSACADLYLDAQSNTMSVMSGWVKLWRAGDQACNKWRSAWATMDEQSIRFYDSDGLANASTNDAPFLQLNLDHDQWRLHMQSVADVGIRGSLSKDSYALLIEIRMTNDSLFLLAPTPQAKQRWVRALQKATNRRMFVQRQQSSVGDGNSMLLGLDAPLNLSINCAQVLNDWILIGAQEGLFITPLISPRVPFVVTGLTAVFHMEFLPELQMLLAISGSNRQLYALHANDVYNSFNSDRPVVRPTPIANYSACHLMAVLKDASNKIRWLCVADPDQVHILQYSTRLCIFSPFKSLSTSEPAMCLLSVPDGFVFGTDQFYYVNINELVARPIVVPGCAPDFPLAALQIRSDELLLAYHNYGVFTDKLGNRLRVENIEWNRAPLEFVYAAPFLYVVHFESLEILRVADYFGPNSGCLLEEREVYRCQSAHYLGRGRTEEEVLFALSGKERTEVHSFFRPSERKTAPSTLKRRQATDDSTTRNPDKRSKK